MSIYQYQCMDCGASVDFFATPYQINLGLKVVCAVCGSSNVRSNIPHKISGDSDMSTQMNQDSKQQPHDYKHSCAL